METGLRPNTKGRRRTIKYSPVTCVQLHYLVVQKFTGVEADKKLHFISLSFFTQESKVKNIAWIQA
jgi:hypothetical protein